MVKCWDQTASVYHARDDLLDLSGLICVISACLDWIVENSDMILAK
jgi:hypothetical protein